MRRVRAWAAAGFLLTVAAGIPVALVVLVGDPLPSSLPSWSQLHLAIASGRVAAHTWIKGLSLVVWAAWARAVWVAGTEGLVARQAWRGRRAYEPQRAGSPVAWLVAAVVTGLWAAIPASAAPAGAVTLPPGAASISAVGALGPSGVPAPAPPGAVDAAGAPPPAPAPSAPPEPGTVPGSYVVRRGDSLWDIAASHLRAGAPLASVARHWRAIWSLNRDRDMGGGMRFTDPNRLYPGWVLELPPSLRRPPAPTGPPGKPGRGAEPASTPPSRPSPSSTTTDRPASSRPPDLQGNTGRTGAEVELGAGLGLGLLGAGITGELVRRRRHQLRARTPDRRIRLPAGEDADLARRVAASADLAGARWVDLGLRQLGASLRRTGGAATAPTVLEVRLTPESLTVGADGPTPAAPPFETTGAAWHLPRTDPGALAEAGSATAPVPALVTIGRLEGEAPGELVLANLEARSPVAVEGSEEEVVAALRAMAAELATAPWSECREVVLVGVAPGLSAVDQVRTATHLEEVLEGVEQVAGEIEALAAPGPGPPGTARLVDQEPCWAPSVVLVGPGEVGSDLDRLARLARRPGVVAVVAAPLTGAWTLRVAGNRLVAPDGVDLHAQQLSEADDEGVARVLAAAAPGAEAARSEPPYDTLGPDLQEAEVEVEVRLLGPVELQGGVVRSDWSKVLELLAYLACHPEGVATAVWEAALWPERRVAPGTRRNLLSYARRALGSGPDGQPRLTSQGGRAQLVGVGSDWGRFRHLAAGDPAAWGDALALVRGAPLGGMDAPWARVEGHLATMEQEVVDVALHLAGTHQDLGDHRRAAWAARQGLRASPWDERLYRTWMRAASSAGNQTGVQAAWDQLIATLEADCDPTLAVEPETAETYRALRGPGRRHG